MIQRNRKIDTEDKPTRYFSKIQEKAVAKKLNGRVQPNSGATAFAKGDVRLDDSSFLIECKTKTTPSDSMSIKKSWLEKNMHEALFLGKQYNALAFNFGPNEKNYYVIDEDTMFLLINLLKENSAK